MVLELDEQAATPSKRTGSRTMEKEGRRRTWGMEERGKKEERYGEWERREEGHGGWKIRENGRRIWGAEEKGKEKEGFGNGRERRIRKGISGTEEIGRKKDTRNGREGKKDMVNERKGKKKRRIRGIEEKRRSRRRETREERRPEKKMTVVCTTNSGRYTEVWQIIGGRQRSDPMKSPSDTAQDPVRNTGEKTNYRDCQAQGCASRIF